MSISNNKYISFSLYRDTDLEAFYDIDKKYRWKIIFAHMMIHLLPVLVIILYFRAFTGVDYLLWALIVALIFYTLVVLETVAYMFPSSRTVFKRYFPWILIALAIIGGPAGYLIGIEISNIESELNITKTLAAGLIGGFAIFFWTYLGMSLVLQASRAIYTKKADIEADVRFATEVQNRILEDISVEHDSVRAYAASFPANELGGDFFELSIHNGSLFASVGDVSGHSFGAGLLMTMTKSALQTHLNYNSNPSEIVSSLNHMFLKQSDRAMYATMSVMKLNTNSFEAELCNAGHLPLLQYSADEDRLIPRHKKALGLGMTDKAEYDNLKFPVKNGDLLFLYSDGLIETRDEKLIIRETQFFEEIIEKAVSQSNGNPKDLVKTIFSDVQKMDYSDTFEDDATLIVVKV